jgi:GT2 family glycosyltransferase
MKNSDAFPKISIVTPSYNQEGFIEATIRSVVGQEYPNLEYIIIEDGSTDKSLEIIQRYQDRLAHLVVGPNKGFGGALNAGLKLCTGEIMAWINADDFYLTGAFETVARVFKDCPQIDWIVGASLICDPAGRPISINSSRGYGKSLFFSGRYLGGHPAWSGQWIPQESVFWRRSLWDRAGGTFLTERLQYGDFELWSRFWQFSDLYMLPVPLAAYRCHPQTYTSQQGHKSTEPCTKILEAGGIETFSPINIRLRNFGCRFSDRFARYLGEPAKVLEFDLRSNRWKIVTNFVM